MANAFIKDGQYFKTMTDIDPPPGAVAVPERPNTTDTWDGSAWVAQVETPALLSEAQVDAETHVDQVIGGLRLAYITEIPGQQMVYQAKEAEAIAFLAASPLPVDLTPYPYIAGEALALGVTAATVAGTYSTLATQWRAVGAQLEALRIGSKAAIQAATTIAGVEAAKSAFDTAVGALDDE